MKLWKKVYLFALLIITLGINAGFLGIIYYTYEYMLGEEKDRCYTEFMVLRENISADIAKMEESASLDVDYFRKFLVAYNSYYESDTQLMGMAFGKSVTERIPAKELPLDNGILIRDEEQTTVIYVSQILDDDHDNYRIVMRRTLDNFDIMWSTLQPMYIIGGIILSLGVSLTLAFAVRMVLKPMDKLEAATRKMQEGDLATRVEIAGKNELSKLGDQFNLMADAIEENIKELEQQSQQKQELINNLAHEMNTPITSIQGFADYMKMSKLSEEEHEECLDFIVNESKRLKDISSTLLDMANMEVSKNKFSIKAVCDRLNGLYAKKFESKKIAFRIVCEIEIMFGNGTLIEGLMRNLINNAYNAVSDKENGEINTRIYKCSNHVIIKISDNGCGISTEHIGHIFEPFYRVDKARSRMKGGSGLGLPLCYKIAQIHGGSIDVESVVGEGTTFLVNLPFDNLLENI